MLESSQEIFSFFEDNTCDNKIKGCVKAPAFAAAELYPASVKAAALNLTAMPISQVSVERLFSGLKFLLSDQRSSMKADLIESLLFLRTNTSR